MPTCVKSGEGLCPNLKVISRDANGETWQCSKCGTGFYVDRN